MLLVVAKPANSVGRVWVNINAEIPYRQRSDLFPQCIYLQIGNERHANKAAETKVFTVLTSSPVCLERA